VLGLALALAGAHVTLSDLPHVTPLCRENVAANAAALGGRATVVDHGFGDNAGPLLAHGPYDLVVAADTLYWPEFHGQLLASLTALVGGSGGAPAIFAYRCRSGGEAGFEAAAAAAGFAIAAVPASELSAEYTGDGRYRVIRLARAPS
jgi:hypothetical protein